MAKKIEIHEPEEIDTILKYINENKIEFVIGKFSPYCPVSLGAEKTFDKWTASVGDILVFTKVNVVSEKNSPACWPNWFEKDVLNWRRSFPPGFR